MIEFACTCGKWLGVGEELAGKQARCPACGQPVNVPGGAGGAAAFPGAGPGAFPAPVSTPPAGPSSAAPWAADVVTPYGDRPIPVSPVTSGSKISGLAIAGLALGVFGCSCITAPIGLGLSVGGLMASQNQQHRAGTTIAAMGIALNLLWLMFFVGSFFFAPAMQTSDHRTDHPATDTSGPNAPIQENPLIEPETRRCTENLRVLWQIHDTHKAAKRQPPPGTGERFLDALEKYGNDVRIGRAFFVREAPQPGRPGRYLYRAPARPLRADLPGNTPLLADREDTHADGSVHVLYLDGTVKHLRSDDPELATVLEATQ